MGEKIWRKIQHYRQISIVKFLYFNFLCAKVQRKKGCYLIPYKNSRIQLGTGARIVLHGNLSIGINKIHGSKAETYVRLGDHAEWLIEEMAILYFNVHVEIHKHAKLITGHCGMNSGSVIVCAKHIEIGNYVMLGRNVLIYDSDHHDILDKDGNILNAPRDVRISDHVWLTNNIVIQKGSVLHEGSIVGAYTVINKEMPAKSFIVGSPGRVIKEANDWIWDLQ